jgi:hypothetical protein
LPISSTSAIRGGCALFETCDDGITTNYNSLLIM